MMMQMAGNSRARAAAQIDAQVEALGGDRTSKQRQSPGRLLGQIEMFDRKAELSECAR